MIDYKKYSDLLWKDDKYKFAIQLLNGQKYEKSQVDKLFDGVILDTSDFHFLVLLSILGSSRGWLYFPKNAVPRLSGLLRYNSSHNRRLLNESANICADLKKKHIPALLSGDLSACFYCETAIKNIVSKAAVMVPSSVKMGYSQYVRYPFNPSGGDRILAYMLRNAVTQNIAGKDIKIPSLEDLVIFLLLEGYYEIAAGITCDESHQWMLSLSLLADRIEWKSLLQRSVILGVNRRISLMLKFFDTMVPGVVSMEDLEESKRDIRWIERRYKLSRISNAEKMLYYVSDKGRRIEALRYLRISRESPLRYILKSMFYTAKRCLKRGDLG